jgi:hypothetical protein
MARKRSKDKSTKSGLGGLVLFGAAVLLAAIGFLLKDFYGIRYGFVGSYIWFLAFLITFSLGLFYFAQFLLPLRWQDSWYEGLRLTINYNFPSLPTWKGLPQTDAGRVRRCGRGALSWI